MKRTTLEPGLLRLIQILSVFHVASILVIRRLLGARFGIEVPAGGTLLLSLAIPIFLVFFTWIPWWREKLGRVFLPIGLALISIEIITDKYLTLLWLVPPDQQDLELIMLMMRIWFTFHIITLLVAWQYPWVWTLVAAMILSIADLLLSFPFISSDSPLYQLFLYLFAIRTQTVTIVALGIGWLLTRQRKQNAALAEANQKLTQYASTAERLAVSQERMRLAQELHDTLAHSLSSVTVQLEAAESIWGVDEAKAHNLLKGALSNTRSGLTEARRALQALRAGDLEEVGLRVAVGNLARSTATRANLTLDLRLPDELPSLTQAEEQCLYRVTQEGLSNVARHARATRVRVELQHIPGQLTLTIADDGKGFDMAKVNGGHFGLKGLRERADLVGAKLEILSEPQRGTTLILRAPLTEM